MHRKNKQNDHHKTAYKVYFTYNNIRRRLGNKVKLFVVCFNEMWEKIQSNLVCQSGFSLNSTSAPSLLFHTSLYKHEEQSVAFVARALLACT